MKLNKALLAGLLALVMLATACVTSWVSEAIAITNALLPVAVNVIQMVTAMQGSGANSTDVALAQKWAVTVSADLTLVQTLLNQYNTTPAAEKAGVLGRLDSALQVVNSDLGTLLPALHIANPQTQAKVTAMVGLVEAEVRSIIALVAAAQHKTAITHGTAKALSAGEFRKAYKAVVKAPTGYAALDRATKELALP